MRARRRLWFLSAWLLLSGAVSHGAVAATEGAAALDRPRGALAAAEWLTQPTADGVTVSVIPARPLELALEVWPQAGGPLERTAPIEAEPGRLAEVRIEGLEPATEYAYRLVQRATTGPEDGRRSGPPPWTARSPHRFRTAPEPGASFRFGFLTDSHLVFRWKRAVCGDVPEGFEAFARTLRNAASRDLDFVVLGGDEALTHRAGKGACRFGGEPFGRGTATSRREADRRYLLMRRAYEPLAALAPIHYVLGNHEGEAGFERAPRLNSHSPRLSRISRAARLAHLPNPQSIYGGGSDGNYFAFEWGDALVVALDVMRYTPQVPRTPAEWTLGAEQLAWLERTLAESDAAWKVVVAHHLVGGVPHVRPVYHYGRGGVLATEDGTRSGRFLGEQRRVQELMARHGAQLFLFGHDHLFSIAEKYHPDGTPSGVFYACGGTSAGTGAAWEGQARVEQGYRAPGDTATPLTYERGYVELVVHGSEQLIVRYVVTDLDDPQRNATAIHETSIPGPH